MESYKGRFEPTCFEDLTVTVDFHCHSACRFCIVQEGMNYFRGVPFDKFAQAVDDNARTRRYRRLTFTGGEVTLEKKLFDYLDYARQSKSFEHVRLQTNGRLLADAAFTGRLIDAGVDEFFVSLHGHNAETQDYISQRPGSFDEAMSGIANIKAAGACLITNTVLTTLNTRHLTDIVETVHQYQPARMEFWNYLPMEDYADTRELLSPMAELGPALQAALDRGKSYGIDTGVKYVPRCLLGEHGDALDNSQADVVIVEAFYDVYPKFACIYEAKCEHSEACLGLHHPYITKFGWEEALLRPVPRKRPWREPEVGLAVGSNQPGSIAEPSTVASTYPEWRALVQGVGARQHYRLASVEVQRRTCTFRFALGDASVDVVLTARDEEAPALARSRSFNVHYRNVLGNDRVGMAALVRAAVEAIIARDDGQRLLDRRKGLVGSEAVRRSAAPGDTERRGSR